MSYSRLLAFVAVAGGLGCSAGGPRFEEPTPVTPTQDAALLAHARDTALLSTIVRALQSDAGRQRVVVDPRLLPPDSQLVGLSKEIFARVPQGLLEARANALRGMGIEPGDAVALSQDSCPGIFFLPERRGENPHSGCPKQQMYVAAIGLPRPGTARMGTADVYDQLRALAAEGYWAVRIVRTILGPRGSSLGYYDYVIKQQGGAWTFIKAFNLFNSE